MQSFLMKAKVIHDRLVMSAIFSFARLVALILTKVPSKYDTISWDLWWQGTRSTLSFDDLNFLLLEEKSILVS